jgi:F-type H+-transporting ATPase subunit a
MSDSNTKEAVGHTVEEVTTHKTADTHEEAHHEHTLYAEQVASVGGFPVTNSLINSWIAVVLIVVASLLINKKIKKIPGKVQGVCEVIIEKFLELFDSVTGSREKSSRFFPFVFAFFIFILINNWMGLLPGIGSVGQIVEHNGHETFVPYFRGATADLNTTLALALVGVIVSHIVGIATIGFWHYINKFINIEALLAIPKKVKEDPSVLFVNPIKVFTGVIEIVSEIAKVLSLSFRLFGNIFAGEVLLAFMAGMLAFGLPLPFMFLEVMVGLIQALIFAMLVLAYLEMMTMEH